ncbi:MAG: sodium:proton exchanger [Conexibacter sp.]|nr:sodium:proton exchanger [Conexibacter sp.]
MSALSRAERLTVAGVLGLTALAGVAHYAGFASLLAFGIAALALAGLAHVVSFATEQVGRRFGPGVTGVLQSTLGNLPELFVVIFALRAGEVVVAQTSIIGSLFANALLVLGAVIVVGAATADGPVMRFKPRLPQDTATLLLVTVFIIVVVGISLASHDPASHHVQAVSTVAAVALLGVYLAWVVPYVRADAGANADAAGASEDSAADEDEDPLVPLTVSAGLLAIGGVGAAFVSDWFVAALRPTIDQLHISEAFAGIVIVAIAGNAVENVAGLVLARKGKADLAISVVKNSVAQIAAFLYPVLVLVSLLFSHHLNFALDPVYIGALLMSALAVWQITGDGEAAAFEGWALIALYVVLGALTLYE